MNTPLEIHGSLLQGLLSASHSLELLLRENDIQYEADRWYPIAELTRSTAAVEHYAQPGHILRRVGMEMMSLWYQHGPGRYLVGNGLEFLHFQSGSGGYRSVIRGPEEAVGEFTLAELDEEGGTATIDSSTPFPRELESGILLGGLGLTDHLAYYEVDYDVAASRFLLRFVTDANRGTLSWHRGDVLAMADWRLRHVQRMHALQEQYWRAIHDTLKSAYAQLQQLATRDHLSGARTRREFDRLAALEFERARRHGEPLAVIYLDIDRFKAINDCFGHDCGDRVIAAAGAAYAQACRVNDVVGRLGGDEFVILCPHTNQEEAEALAQRLLAATAALEVPHADGAVRVTASFGIAVLGPQHRSAAEVVTGADRALLTAKRAGRNRVVLA